MTRCRRLRTPRPAKLYLMFGANKLVDQGDAAEDTLLSSYATFIDDLKAKLPQAKIYIQSILTPTAAGTEAHPGLSPERIARVNGGCRPWRRKRAAIT